MGDLHFSGSTTKTVVKFKSKTLANTSENNKQFKINIAIKNHDKICIEISKTWRLYQFSQNKTTIFWLNL